MSPSSTKYPSEKRISSVRNLDKISGGGYNARIEKKHVNIRAKICSYGKKEKEPIQFNLIIVWEANHGKIISGKVREVYRVDDAHLVIVTTDRISTFDVILDSEIPGKGEALNLLSNFWFSFTKDIIPNHLLSVSLSEMTYAFREQADYYQDRTVLVKNYT